MFFGIFTHVETHQIHAHLVSEYSCHLGFAHAGGTHKQQTCHRLVFLEQPRTRHLHRFHHTFQCLILAIDFGIDALIERVEVLIVGIRVGEVFHLAYLGKHLRDAVFGYSHLVVGVEFEISAGFVDEVDGFIGQRAIVDIAGACLYGIFYGIVGVSHAVKALKSTFQASENVNSLVDRRLGDVDLLKIARDARRIGKASLIVGKCGGADKLNLAVFEVRFKQIGSIYMALAGGAGAHYVVYAVDIHYGVALLQYAVHNSLYTLFEFAAILSTRHQTAEVELIYRSSQDSFGSLVVA